ncbi:MAG TPA: ATP-binding cassette domain-containing protein [bacterium]|nr:ATP-binding cassette domain-containing protein [bacterium]
MTPDSDSARAAPQAVEPVGSDAVPPAQAIRTLGLTRRFGALAAVDDASIEVHHGEIFGLIGPNGAGKSTMIKILTTLLPPTTGHAWVAGFDVVSQAPRVRRRIGYVPQLVSADGALTGYENLLLSAQLYNIPPKECARRIHEALTLIGLQDAANKQVSHYSGGMVRSLEIAQSTLHHPAVLFADEPTVGLDPIAHRAVWEHLHELQQRFQMTILVTTHSMEEADQHCARVAVMHRGQVVVVGSPASLKAQVGPAATLDDAFIHFTGATLEQGGDFRELLRTRHTARRLS